MPQIIKILEKEKADSSKKRKVPIFTLFGREVTIGFYSVKGKESDNLGESEIHDILEQESAHIDQFITRNRIRAKTGFLSLGKEIKSCITQSISNFHTKIIIDTIQKNSPDTYYQVIVPLKTIVLLI